MTYNVKNFFTKPFLAMIKDTWEPDLANKYDGFFCTFVYHVPADGGDFPQETCAYLKFRGGVLQPYLIVGKPPERLWDSIIFSGSSAAWQQFIVNKDYKHLKVEELFAADDDAQTKRVIGQNLFSFFDGTEDILKQNPKFRNEPEKCVRTVEDGYLLFNGGMEELRAVINERKIKVPKGQFSTINKEYEELLKILKKASPKDMSSFWAFFDNWPEPDRYTLKTIQEIPAGLQLTPGLKRELLSLRSKISNEKELYEAVQKRLKAGIQ